MDSDFEAYKKALEIKHGKLLGCSYFSSSNGMMMNSNSLLSYDLEIDTDDDSVLTVRNKAPFGKTFTTVYQIKDEDLKDLLVFIKENKFWAFGELQYYQDPRFIVYDYSSNSGITLKFDDREVGGTPFEYFSIKPDAMYQYKFDEQCKTFVSEIQELMNKGELLSSEESGEDSNFFGNMETKPKPDVEITEDNEVCPTCGYKPVTGRFCPECGSQVKK